VPGGASSIATRMRWTFSRARVRRRNSAIVCARSRSKAGTLVPNPSAGKGTPLPTSSPSGDGISQNRSRSRAPRALRITEPKMSHPKPRTVRVGARLSTRRKPARLSQVRGVRDIRRWETVRSSMPRAFVKTSERVGGGGERAQVDTCNARAGSAHPRSRSSAPAR
jgi:hypothetical protein